VASETELSKLIYERGVDEAGFARIRSKGDEALFSGLTTSEMKNKLKIPQKRPLADFLPTITITAKNLADSHQIYDVTEKEKPQLVFKSRYSDRHNFRDPIPKSVPSKS